MLHSPLLLLILLSTTAHANFSLKPTSPLLNNTPPPNNPPECPPCFNCMLPEQFPCLNYADCSPFSGRCECPTGFGGDNCSQPVCGALSDGEERPVRTGNHCECKDGWEGINCNVCNSDLACDAMMPPGLNGTCYRGGLTVNSNYQQCNVTNPKIIDLLHGPIPQVTFSCDRNERGCEFQFWVDEIESFYCSLDQCEFRLDNSYDRNVTVYECPQMKCSCVPGEFLCGKDGSVDITDFLAHEIKGPGRFTCDTSTGCKFEEPAMNQLITDVFGDGYISLQCESGECVHYSQVPGFVRPPPPDRTIAIAVAIGFVVAFLLATIILSVWLVRKSRKDENKYRQLSTSAEDDDLANKFLDDHIPANLMFTNVSYCVAEKQVLHGIYGNVKPGQVMAIMGASGAGKTSFLDILARRTKSGTVTGDFFVNGTNADDAEFKRVVGYVDQEDTLMPTLTVYETILYSALLRLPRDMSDDAKKMRVLETMTELGIMKIRDNRIGDTGTRGISGGEKRRVSIACELVTSPSILFLDEPTSGLDSYNAYNVVECLVTLARNYNRTVICTIHQPRSNIFALFDQLVLLASGRLVYSGNAQDVREHFESIGHPCPPGFNIADFAVDLTMHAISHDDDDEGTGSEQVPKKKFPRYSDRDEESAIGSESASGRAGNAGPSTSARSKRAKSVRSQQEQQLYTPHPVSSRPTSPAGGGSTAEYWENAVSQPVVAPASPGSGHEFVSDHLSLLIEGYAQCETARRLREEIRSVAGETTVGPHRIDRLIISAGYQRSSWLTQFRILSDRTMKNLYRNPSLMLTHYAISVIVALTCGFLFFRVTNDIAGFQNRMGVMFFLCALLGFGCLTSLQVLSAERILFVRERANGYYSPFTYFASKVLFDVIPLRVVPPLLLGIIVYPMVGLNAEVVSWAKFLLVLVLFDLTAASVCLFVGIAFRDLGVASLVSSLVMLFAMLFGGLLLNKDSLPPSMQWAKDVSFFHSAFEAMMVNEMVYLQLTEKKYGLEIDVPGATILSTFGLDVMSYWPDVGKLLFTFLVFVVGSFVWLQMFVREKR